MQVGDRIRVIDPKEPLCGREGTVTRVAPAAVDRDGRQIKEFVYARIDGQEFILPWQRHQIQEV